ncbi:MAG: alkaline phosphatase family protein [Planctomycetota bacterium]
MKRLTAASDLCRLPAAFASALALLAVAGLGTAAVGQRFPGNPKPRLCVLLSVDQLAEWVFASAEPWFAEDGGFRRLQDGGVTFANCAYEHACTETGPGHATIGTGAPACVHGVGKNAWWSPERGESIYCVEAPAKALEELPEGANRGPIWLRAPTLSASVKAHLPGSKVASISWKDRSAILMGGAAADICAWFDTTRGMLVTNRTWCDEVPQWLAEFNQRHEVSAWFGSSWTRTGPEQAYDGLVDDRVFERVHANGLKGHTLPQPLTGGDTEPKKAYYSQIYASPFGNTAVRLAAEAALVGMDLGGDDVPDLLCVSFSSTDVVGHYFGPDSVEARDALLRLDRDLGKLFDAFDKQAGVGGWSIFVTADHGVAQTPEAARMRGTPAGRGPINAWVRSSVEGALRKQFGPPVGSASVAEIDSAAVADADSAKGDGDEQEAKPVVRYVAHVGDNAVYLNPTTFGRSYAAMAKVAAAAAARVRGVQSAYPSMELAKDHAHPDPIRRALAYGMVDGREGDVQFVLAPYWLNGTTPASHGSPHAYDREVIGFAMGPLIARGKTVMHATTPGFGVVLLAHLLSIPKPSGARENVTAELFVTR